MRMPVGMVIEKIVECHGGVVTLDVDTYVGVTKKARFIDHEHGAWWTQPSSVMRGKKHPKRAMVMAHKKTTLALDVVIDRLSSIHGGKLSIVPGTYVNTNTKCAFIDVDYGEWITQPVRPLRGCEHPQRAKASARATSVTKYGVSHPMQSPTVQKAASKASKKASRIEHWNTGESLVCTASYERAFVNWCNRFQIDFDWQVPVVTSLLTPGGCPSTYFVDAYIKSGEHANTWVEIKGRKRNMAKWDWFHARYAHSELWDLQRLQALGIMVGNKPNQLYV